ncbi:hypothetical protein [Paenibacillus solani]|uniref:Uncharacterized protein n=1 Tax=Paenibacillus solani TaxID=1705565 RepID=A0A0M1P009_9BACL|nr:hypothetical protein [Paenibacillus solani]KOR87600.1 hypothetical protein AM231_16990 [Paenibacillus solani]
MQEYYSLKSDEADGDRDTKSIVLEEHANEIRERCLKSNIDYEYTDDYEVIVKLNSGREKYSVIIDNWLSAVALLEIRFEEYIVINNYLAICDYKSGYIEAIIEPIHTSLIVMYRKLFGINSVREVTAISPIQLTQETDSGKIEIELGAASREIAVLLNKNLRRSGSISLKIKGLNISTHDKALEVLQKVSDSLFFQIDLKFKLPIILSKQYNSVSFGMVPNQADVSMLEFPNMQYNMESISLYWYARSARRMPLLQYLAYYQAIEFYYPIYSDVNAKKTLKNMLKDPMFNVNNDVNLTKLINSLRLKLGKGYSNEKTQLMSTLNECIELIELREFLDSNTRREEFFSYKLQDGKKPQAKRLTDIKLSSSMPDNELINALRDRIYNIRCKIVHSKSNESEEDIEIILPFSKEADLLVYDIELIKFIAQKVIISSSNQMFL